MLFYGSLFFLKTGKVGHLCLNDGTIKYESFQLILQSNELFVQQFKNELIGEVVWSNGTKYTGLIKNLKPSSKGRIVNKDHENALFCKNYVYFEKSKKIGKLNLNTGDIDFQYYTLEFDCEDDYILQFDYSSHCIRQLQWSNGNSFRGEIQFNKFATITEVVNQIGDNFTCCNGQLYHIRTGKFFTLNYDTGIVEYQQYIITFTSKQDYVYQHEKQIPNQIRKYNNRLKNLPDASVYKNGTLCLSEMICKCQGEIQWPNGNSYRGKIECNKLADASEIENQNQEFGVYWNQNVYFYSSGKFGRLNYQTGAAL